MNVLRIAALCLCTVTWQQLNAAGVGGALFIRWRGGRGFNAGLEILIALEHLPPTPPCRAGSSAVLASLLGRCRRSGVW